MPYEVQQRTVTDGWINTWSYAEADGIMRLETFATAQEAEAALDEHLFDLQEELWEGQLASDDFGSFRIRCVADADAAEAATAAGGAP